MKCHFCDRPAPVKLSDTIDDGWVLSFWDGSAEVSGPVCPKCCNDRLQFNAEEGDYEPRHRLRPMAMEDYGHGH